MGFHSKFSPSGFYQIELCPGSHKAQEGLPNVNSEPAVRGTAAHKMMEMVLGGNEAMLQQRTLALQNDADVGGYTELQEADTNAVRETIDYVRSIPGLVNLESELKVNPSSFTGSSHTKGSLDIAATIQFLGEDWIEIIDFKNGFVVVDAEENSQMILYMLGYIDSMYEKVESFDPYSYNYKMTIAQPQAYHSQGPIRSVEYAFEELTDFADGYKQVLKNVSDEDAPRTPGAKQCRYCRAKLVCKEFADYVYTEVQGGNLDPRMVPAATLEDALLRHPSTFTKDELRRILDVSPIITSFVKSVQAYASEAYDKGVRGFGYKKVAGKGTKFWGAKDETIESELLKYVKSDDSAVTLADIRKPGALATPTQIVSRLKPHVSKEVLESINKLIRKGNQKAKLVPETDAAPGIGVVASEYFTPETSPEK